MKVALILVLAPRAPGWRYCRPSSGDGALPRGQILAGDALTVLRRLPSAFIDCCITSPPYFQLRDYGVSGQIGLEGEVEGWVEQLRQVLAEVGRVLKPGGSLWLNLGDSYSRHQRYGAPPKSLLLAPERLLLALAKDGWIVRNKVIWAKTNPMPHSVSDRLTTTYEVIYFLVKSGRYRFNLDAIRQPHRSTRRAGTVRRSKYTGDRAWAGALAGSQDGLIRAQQEGRPGHRLGKNPGDVWWLSTAGYPGAHFATFPEALVERPLLASCPERVCRACGAAWQRSSGQPAADLRPTCACRVGWQPGLVLDPFFGAGTVGVVAERLGRDWLGIELNPAFIALAEQRLALARRTRPAPP